MAELGGSDELCGKGSDLTLFLFSDVVEITKRRRAANRGLGSVGRSPSTMSLRNPGALGVIGPMGGGGGTLPGQRPHKHVDMMGLSAIKRVVDLADTDESRDCFTLVCRTNQVKYRSEKTAKNN